MPGSTKQIAPIQNKCSHTPKTTDERNLTPQSEWCDECQESCCVKCLETTHKNHKSEGTEQAILINKIRKEPVKNKALIKNVKNSKHKAWLTERAKPRSNTTMLVDR